MATSAIYKFKEIIDWSMTYGQFSLKKHHGTWTGFWLGT